MIDFKTFDEVIKVNPEVKINISKHISGLVYRSSPLHKPDIGYHFGTLQAAMDRMLDLEREYDIFPYKININNPIRLRDVGAWADFKDVADELLKLGVISENEYLEAEEFAKTQSLRGDEHKVLRDILKSNGYDGIIYKNDSEDRGKDSFIVFDKNNINEITSLDLFKIYQNSKKIGNNPDLVRSVESVIKEVSIRKIVREILKESFLGSNSFNLSDEQLREIAIWGLQGDYSTSGCWDDAEDDLEIAVSCAVEDFKHFISEPYPLGFGNISSKPIIYRFIRLKSVDDLNTDNLGVSWFSNPKQYDVPGFFDMLDYLKPWKNEKGEVFLIQGRTSIDNIDIPNSLWQRSTQWIENEIVLKDGSTSKVEILGIKKASDLK